MIRGFLAWGAGVQVIWALSVAVTCSRASVATRTQSDHQIIDKVDS